MCSHKTVLTCRRAALLLTFFLPALFGLSCAPKPAAPSSQIPRPTASLPNPVLPRTAAKPKPFLPIAFPDLQTNQINSLTFSPDGRHLALSYGADAGVSLWNLDTGRLGWQRHVNAADGGAAQFTPNGRFMISQFNDPDDDTPIIVSTVEGKFVRRLGNFSWGGSVNLEHSGRFLVVNGSQTVSIKGRIYWHAVQSTMVWNTRTWRQTDRTLSLPSGLPGPIPLTASGRIIHRKRGQTPVKRWQPPASAYVIETPDGTYAASSDDTTKQIEAWDLRSHRRLWVETLKGDTPRTPAISPDGQTLAIATLGGYTYLWGMKTGKLLAKTNCSTDVLRCLTFSPNGRVLAVAGGLNGSYDDATEGVHLLDMKTYKVFAVLKVSLANTPDGDTKDWSLNHPDWFAALPDLSYIASPGVVKKIRTPGRVRDARTVTAFSRPARVRAALRKCWQRGR